MTGDRSRRVNDADSGVPGYGLLVAVAALGLAMAMVAVPVPASGASASRDGSAGRMATGDGVGSVGASDGAVTVSGTASPGAPVTIYALGTEQDPSAWRDGEPVARAKVDSDGRFEVSVDRRPGQRALYYAKYVAVVGGKLLGTYRYVDDNEVTPRNSYPYPQGLSKKGLQVQMTGDAEELGNQHAAINVALDQLMQVRDEGPDETITFVSNGREFYFDRAAVEGRDRQIKPLSDNGEVVNLILLVYNNDDENSAAPILIHPDADLSGGPVFGFNTATAEGVAYYTAAMEFLTQRYTREDEKFGRATGFIVGNEIDAQWTWANMGEKPLDEFLLYYERALRITQQAARAAYSEPRVYTSLTHSWTTPSGPAEPAGRYYPGRDVLDGLNAVTKAHGDYPWNVAHHPYPEDLFDPAFWNDETATGDIETTGRITFKNIELLPQYLARTQMRYDGKTRRVILSEQGCNTPDASLRAQKLQAACYALAYYKVRFLDGIDSFILHRHVDHQAEGGLRLGLWTWDEDRPEPSSPGEHKYIYHVFKYIDTKRSLEMTRFALGVIGIDQWSDLVPGFDPDALAQRPLPTVGGASTRAHPRGRTVISDFADGTQGWGISDNASSVTAQDGDLVVGFDALAKLWRGTDLEPPEAMDASDTPYLGVSLRVPASSAPGTRYAKIKAYAGHGLIGEGVARLAGGPGEQHVWVDLSGWKHRDAITRLKIWVRGSTDADWSGTYRIGKVMLANHLAGTTAQARQAGSAVE